MSSIPSTSPLQSSVIARWRRASRSASSSSRRASIFGLIESMGQRMHASLNLAAGLVDPWLRSRSRQPPPAQIGQQRQQDIHREPRRDVGRADLIGASGAPIALRARSAAAGRGGRPAAGVAPPRQRAGALSRALELRGAGARPHHARARLRAVRIGGEPVLRRFPGARGRDRSGAARGGQALEHPSRREGRG